MLLLLLLWQLLLFIEPVELQEEEEPMGAGVVCCVGEDPSLLLPLDPGVCGVAGIPGVQGVQGVCGPSWKRSNVKI